MNWRTDEHGRPLQALGLTSGGLDSLLALLVVRDQGVRVTALTFVSPFLDSAKAEAGTKAVDAPLKIIDFSGSHIEVVKDPPHGHGSNMNPCIDCHILMVRLANEIRIKEGYHFLFTGEVVGQRPMSQNKQSLDLVARRSGAEGYLVRPLSAKKLPPTYPETAGWLDRERLLGLHGRGRKPQLALAQAYGLTEFPTPAGGCILTDPGFSRRLRHLLEVQPLAAPRLMGLLRHGRHFSLGGPWRLILGRSQGENKALAGLVEPTDTVVKAADRPGPLGLIPGPDRPPWEVLDLAGRILLAYTKAPPPQAGVVFAVNGEDTRFDLPVTGKASFQDRLLG